MGRWLQTRLVRLAPIVVGVLLVTHAPAGAAPDTAGEVAPTVSDQQLSDLVDTLEDPVKREQLLQSLQALLAARGESAGDVAAEEADMMTSLLDEIEERTDIVRRVASVIVDSLDQLPLLLTWLEDQLRDPDQRLLWIDVGTRVVLILAVGIVAHVGLWLALRPLRRRVSENVGPDVLEHGLRGAARLVMDLIPVLGFVLASFATMTLSNADSVTRLVVVPLIQAGIVVRSGIAVGRLVFAPKTPDLRILPVDDAAARHAMKWTHRLFATAFYGRFALEAGAALGLPWTIHGFLLRVLFVIVTIMVMVVIVQAREPVAAALAGLAAEDRNRYLRRLPWRGLADVWHVLAVIYVALMYLVWALDVPGGFRLLFQATVGTAAVVAALWAAMRLLDSLVPTEQPPTEDDVAGTLRWGGRMSRYVSALRGLTRVALVAVAAIGLLEVWGFDAVSWLTSEVGHQFSGKLVTVGLMIAGAVLSWEVISILIGRSISEMDAEGNLKLSNRTRTLLNIVRNLSLVLVGLVAVFLILSELGVDLAPLLAGAGVIGLAIGFGSQKLVQDIITGLFVLLGDTVRVGDVIEVTGRIGVVEEMTMRAVVLRDYTGSVHTIPYSAIDTVTNLTKEFSFAVFDIGVAYRENVDQVMEVLRQLGEEMRRDPAYRRMILEPLDVAGVDAFADSAVVIKARFKTRPLRQWEVRREFNRRVKNRFDELGIEIPFPHQTLYFGVDKEGRAPAARVSMEASGDPAVATDTSTSLDTDEMQPGLAKLSRG